MTSTAFLPQVVLVVGCAAGAVAALWLLRPPFDSRTVIASVPWMAVPALLGVIAAVDGYAATTPYDHLRPLLALPWSILVTIVLAAGTWALSLAIGVLRDGAGQRRYLGAAGLGTLGVLCIVVLSVAASPVDALIVLGITPVAAVVVAAFAYYLVGFVSADTLLTLRFAGLAVVSAVVFDGIASAIVDIHMGGAVSPTTAVLRAAAGPVAASTPVWGLVAGHVLVGIAAAVACAKVAHRDPVAGALACLAVATVGIVTGTVTLLGPVVG